MSLVVEVLSVETKIIFYTTHCPMCRGLRMKLDSCGIKYEICEDTEVMLAKGYKHPPVLEVNGQPLSTKEAFRWAEENKCI
jgi:hypothetical protein